MTEEKERANLTITFVIEHGGKFLLIKRSETEKNYPGLWAPTGGRAEIGETMVETIRREVREETGLEITNEAAFLNSYCFGKTVAAAFLVRATGSQVKLGDELTDYKWISSEEELKELPFIAGIQHHYRLARIMLEKGWLSNLEEMNLTKKKYGGW